MPLKTQKKLWGRRLETDVRFDNATRRKIMEAAATYNGTEQQIEVRPYEERSRELQDVLSRSLGSFRRNAFRYLSNAADAEDAVQDALLSAYKHLDQFRGQAQMSTWVTAIVVNSARMQLRRRPQAIHLALDEPLRDDQNYSLAETLADTSPNPEDGCQQSELRSRLMHFVEQLSPGLRTAFQLRALDGLTTSEAAQVLGVPEGTVKSQLTRARAKLAKFMRGGLNPIRHGQTNRALPSMVKQ
jgi:RNA polymerase sigma-70 factor (ECF subfamily)